MWMFCEDGFFSVVQDKNDKSKVQVRARSRADIRRFARSVEMLTSSPVKILCTEKADYLYRVIIPKRYWVKMAALYAESIEYGNFKEHMEHLCRGKAFIEALHEVWSAMWNLQYVMNKRSMKQIKLFNKKKITPELASYQDRVAAKNYDRYQRSMVVHGD